MYRSVVVGATNIADKGVGYVIRLQANLSAGGAVGRVVGVALYGINDTVFIFDDDAHMIDLVAIAVGFEINDVAGAGDIRSVRYLLPGICQILIQKPVDTVYRISESVDELPAPKHCK